MKCRLFLSLALFGLCFLFPVTAQNVAEDVLKSQDLSKINFLNYVGPVKVIESRQQIISIGAGLGSLVKKDPQAAEKNAKYRLLRVPGNPDQLGADVLFLDPQAQVDNIRNLNWIVAGYLQNVFNYSFDDALLLADFVTRYNALWRGKMDYFQKTYVPALAKQVTAENVGIALSYKDWPGKTALVIPLRDTLSKGKSGSVNAEEISSAPVTDSMKKEPDALDKQKKLADLKEGEIVQEQKTISDKKADVAQKEAQIAQAGSVANPAQPAAAQANQPNTPQAPAASPSPNGSTQTGAQNQPGQTQTKPAATDGKALEEEKKQIAQAEKANNERDQKLQEDRKQIAQTEQKQQAQPPLPVKPQKAIIGTPFLQVVQSGGLSRLVLVDLDGSKVWKVSEINSIRRGIFQPFGKGYLVTAGENRGNGAVKLVILSTDNLAQVAVSALEASPEANVLIQSSEAYAVVKNASNQWVVGLYDVLLNQISLSEVQVRPDTVLAAASTGLMVQTPQGFVLLDFKSLKKKTPVEEN